MESPCVMSTECHRGSRYPEVGSVTRQTWLSHRKPESLLGHVHGRGHPSILQTRKSPGPVMGPKDPTKIFYFFIFFNQTIFHDFFLSCRYLLVPMS
jgi:hypothetical protein